MSILRNLLGSFMPHFESRRSSGSIAVNGGEVVHALDGDESVTIYIQSTGTLNATYNFQGSINGTDYFDLVTYPYAPANIAGTLPQPAQPVVSEAVNVADVRRLYCAAVGGLRFMRVRLTAWTAGTAVINITSDDCASVSPFVSAGKAATLMVTATGAVSAAVTLTIPAVVGLRHYVDSIKVTRSATAALTASATPVVVTTTNLPGSPAITFGSDAAGIGIDKLDGFDYGGAGLAASAVNTATTVVCPVYTGVIWRVNAAYRLGL